jgi:hypothetical protein
MTRLAKLEQLRAAPQWYHIVLLLYCTPVITPQCKQKYQNGNIHRKLRLRFDPGLFQRPRSRCFKTLPGHLPRNLNLKIYGFTESYGIFPDYFGIIVKLSCKWAYSHGDNINLNKFLLNKPIGTVVQYICAKSSTSRLSTLCVHTPDCTFGYEEIKDIESFSFRWKIHFWFFASNIASKFEKFTEIYGNPRQRAACARHALNSLQPRIQ